ncbi:MAG: hypothetical protein JSW50_02995, partial [Candidatus Latescibacterota bacterium]
GTSDPITIIPGPPSGTITAAADPDTITANGVKTTDVISDPIRDANTNLVAEGTLITVSTDRGTIISDDVDPAPGLQRATGADGRFSFVLRSSVETTLQVANLGFVSVDDAGVTGSAAAYFAPVPVLVCNEVDPVPSTVFPGQYVGFRATVRNTTNTGVLLTAGTVFEFENAGVNYFAPLAASSPHWVGGGETKVLEFDSTTVAGNMPPGSLTPTIDFAGQDEFGELFSQTASLPAQSLNVVAMEIAGIGNPDPVVRGNSYQVTVLVNNQGGVPASVTSVALEFTGGDYDVSFSGPVVVPALTNNHPIPVDVFVRPSTNAGNYQIGATVSGIVDTAPFMISSGYLSSWDVVEGASLLYVDGSLDPMVASQGQTHGFTVRLYNDGDATVSLQTGSYLAFTDGSNPYQAFLKTNTAISAGQTVTLEFNDVQIAGGFQPGFWPVDLHLVGTENGGSYTDDLTIADQLEIVTPIALLYNDGTLDPQTVTRLSGEALNFGVNNSGGAKLELWADSCTIYFSGYEATINAGPGARIPTGDTLLTFNPATVNSAAGTYFPRVRLVGTENGITRVITVDSTDPLVVQPAADITIPSTSASPDTITRDELSTPVNVAVVVSNNGGNVRLDNAEIRMVLGGVDYSDRFVITPLFSTGSTIPPSPPNDTLRFSVEDNGGNSMPIGNYTIESQVWVTDVSNNQLSASGSGSLVIQAPGVLVVDNVWAQYSSVTEDQSGWTVYARVRNTGGATLRLNLPLGASLDFVPADLGWQYDRPNLPNSGDLDLISGEEDILEFTITGTGAASPLPYQIGSTVTATEKNNQAQRQGSLAPSSGGVVTVLSHAELSLSISSSQPSVTAGATQGDWTVIVDATNTGGSAARVDLGSSQVQFSNGASGFVVEQLAGTIDIAGGATQTITFTVSTTGTVSQYGPVDIQVTLPFVELNTNIPGTADSTEVDAVEVQELPDVRYVPGTASPDTLAQGQTGGFTLRVDNIPSVPATVVLDPAATTIQFASALYSAELNPDPNSTIPAGITELRFNQSVVDPSIDAGTYPIQLRLVGTQNGNSYTPPVITLEDSIVVVEPSVLAIESIEAPMISTVTAGQDNDWYVEMKLTNNGQAPIDVDLGVGATTIDFVSVNDGVVTAEYEPLDRPTGFEDPIGGTRLEAGDTGTLVYWVRTTGTTLGTIVLNGHAEGQDAVTAEPVSDDAVGGSFTVQKPGALVITGTSVSQSPVTEGQTGWTVDIGVSNPDPQSATVRLELPDSAQLAFTPNDPGWLYDKPDVIDESGLLELAGGESGTLVFPITGTGAPDTFAIDSRVTAIESNTDQRVVATSDAGAQGTVIVQGAAGIQITFIDPTTDPVTEGQDNAWTIRVGVSNNGGADVTLSLDDTLTYVEFPNSVPANARFD